MLVLVVYHVKRTQVWYTTICMHEPFHVVTMHCSLMHSACIAYFYLTYHLNQPPHLHMHVCMRLHFKLARLRVNVSQRINCPLMWHNSLTNHGMHLFSAPCPFPHLSCQYIRLKLESVKDSLRHAYTPRE
jgi:hypothetical protein